MEGQRLLKIEGIFVGGSH